MFLKEGQSHSGAKTFPALGVALQFPGGFFLFEMILVALFNLGTGRLYLENIFNKALPEVPKFAKFRWSRSPEVCGVCIGIYPACFAATCCVSCCDPDKKFMGQNTWSNRGACIVYTIFMGSLAGILTLVGLHNAASCFLSYIWECTVRNNAFCAFCAACLVLLSHRPATCTGAAACRLDCHPAT